MNILANILFDSRNHRRLTGISIFFFPLPYICWQMAANRGPRLVLDNLMFTQSFMTSKTRRAHLDVYRSRIKEQPGLKYTSWCG